MQLEQITQEDAEKLIQKRIDEFCSDEGNMKLVNEAAQRVKDYCDEIHYPSASVDKIVEVFTNICSIHEDMTVDRLEEDLKTMAKEARETFGNEN